jgi:hypothetical protein
MRLPLFRSVQGRSKDGPRRFCLFRRGLEPRPVRKMGAQVPFRMDKSLRQTVKFR